MPTKTPTRFPSVKAKMNNMDALHKKVVLVTGAGKGAGRKLALAFARRGAFVAANDISPINLETVVDEITAAGGQARAYIHDVAKKVDVQAMLNNLGDDFGRLDILVNGANVQPGTGLLDIDEWDLHRVFEVNAIGTLLVMQSAGRMMRAAGGGIIINVVRNPAQASAAIQASRDGILSLTARAALELGPHNIRVYGVGSGLPQLATGVTSLGLVETVLALCAGELEAANGQVFDTPLDA